jgi:kynurenine formamidase
VPRCPVIAPADRHRGGHLARQPCRRSSIGSSDPLGGRDRDREDPRQSRGFESHIALLRAGIPALENLAGLEQLPDSGFTVVALPIKIRGGSGGPLRAVAIVPD